LASWTASTKANTGASNIFKSACMCAGEAFRYGCCRLTACYYPSYPRGRMKNVFLAIFIEISAGGAHSPRHGACLAPPTPPTHMHHTIMVCQPCFICQLLNHCVNTSLLLLNHHIYSEAAACMRQNICTADHNIYHCIYLIFPARISC
jgi:hypothetical protein